MMFQAKLYFRFWFLLIRYKTIKFSDELELTSFINNKFGLKFPEDRLMKPYDVLGWFGPTILMGGSKKWKFGKRMILKKL